MGKLSKNEGGQHATRAQSATGSITRMELGSFFRSMGRRISPVEGVRRSRGACQSSRGHQGVRWLSHWSVGRCSAKYKRQYATGAQSAAGSFAGLDMGYIIGAVGRR